MHRVLVLGGYGFFARRAERDGASLPEAYQRDARRWFWLGVPAFLSLIMVFWLMVAKPF